MSKIVIRGYQQRRHVKRLFTENGHEVSEFSSTKPLQFLRILDYIKQIGDCDMLYFVGGNITKSRFYIKIAKKLGKKVVIHWAGSDVYYLSDRIDKHRPYFKGVIHLACSEKLTEELKEFDIDSAYVPLVPYEMDMSIQPLPPKHCIMVYLPQGKEEFYGVAPTRELALAHPEIIFHIVANEGTPELELPNVVFHKKMELSELNELYKEVSVLVRLTEHDGLPMMMLESLAKGKTVLYRFGHPYTYCPVSMNREDILRVFDEIVSSPPVLNEEGSRYVREFYSPESVTGMYLKYGVFDKE